MTETDAALRRIKLIHTLAWALFASAILVIPFLVWTRAFGWALALSALVSIEVLVLVASRMRCPLTGVAARYTDDRSANFDIYLSVWLARHNKLIFGSLLVLDEIYLVSRWVAA